MKIKNLMIASFTVLTVNAAFAAGNVPDAPEYYLNGPTISIAVYKNGSARITESCGSGEIDSGWNLEGREMQGTFRGGPIGGNVTKETLTATTSNSRKGNVRVVFNGDRSDAEYLNKSNQQAHFMICL